MESEDAKSRLRRVLGEEGLARLEEARVTVAGIGGVGSNCAEALVRGGVGHVAFIDADDVALSNINRQAVAFMSTLGRPKVDVMRNMARDINPDIEVVTRQVFLTADDCAGVLDDVIGELGGCDYLIDAIDTVSAKIALAKYGEEHGIPVVASMGGANKTDPTRLAFADLYETSVDPLCRAMRKMARGAGIGHLQVLYSDEQPVRVEVDPDAPRSERPELGTMSYMPPIMGQMIAGFVIRALLK